MLLSRNAPGTRAEGSFVFVKKRPPVLAVKDTRESLAANVEVVGAVLEAVELSV